jgi:hypothetical protein
MIPVHKGDLEGLNDFIRQCCCTAGFMARPDNQGRSPLSDKVGLAPQLTDNL